MWFDPERHYEAELEQIVPLGCRAVRYTGSYFRLREEVDPWIRAPERPRLLVYLPLSYDDARLPLAELVVFGEILRPGDKGLSNTKLAVIARRALKGLVPEARLENLDQEVEKSRLSLRELEERVAGGSAGLSTVLSVIFGTPYPEEAALSFLSSSERDAELAARGVLPDLAETFRRQFEAPLTKDMSLEEIRHTLARHVLTAEFLDVLGDDAPAGLRAVATPRELGIARRCAELAAAWQNRLDLSDSYLEAALRVERSLHLDVYLCRGK